MSTQTLRLSLSLAIGLVVAPLAHAGPRPTVTVPNLSQSELLSEAKAATLELQQAITDTNEMTGKNAKRIRAAFNQAFAIIHSTFTHPELGDAAKLKVVTPLLETIGTSYGDLAEPFTDMDTSAPATTLGERIGNWARSMGTFTARQANFWFLSWFRSGSETPLETARRTRIGKEVFSEIGSSLEHFSKLDSSDKGAMSARNELLAAYVGVIERGIQSEPYRYRKLTKTFMMSVVTVAGFYALMPREVQQTFFFLPPVDYFPPFTFMERSFGSVLVARGLWAIYGAAGYLFPRLVTGYNLGSRIEKTRLKFEAIKKEHGITDPRFECNAQLKSKRG